MYRTLDAAGIQANYEPSATDSASTPNHSYVPSHEPSTNGCEQDSLRLTSVNELVKIDHWKPAEPQFCKDIAAHYEQSKRTIQKWFVDLREIAPWFSEAELRLSDDRYSSFAVELLGDRYFTGSKRKWASVLAERFVGRVETWNSAQSSTSVQSPFPVTTTVASVPVLTPQKLTTLDQLAEKTGEMVPYRRSVVTLNSTQDEALDAIALITERLEQMQKQNEEKRKALEARKQNLRKMDGVVGALVSLGRSAEQEAFDLNDDVKDLKRDEADLKKRLAELLQTIS